MLNVTKLSSVNILTWSIQIKSLLKGYNLVKYIDSTTAIPSPTVTTNGVQSSNPEFEAWQRQDSLLYSVLIGAIDTTLQPLIATAATSLEAWTILARMYAEPTRGHIKQLKQQLKKCVKGTLSVDDYIRLIKTKADALALLGNPLDPDDITDCVLDGLNDDFKPVIDSVQNRDTPIPFMELHEKLMNRENALVSAQASHSPFPVTAHHVRSRNKSWNKSAGTNSANQNNGNRPSHNDTCQIRPYLGKCQACGSPTFRLVTQAGSGASPQAYTAILQPPETPSWLLDSGASNHITSDLANLSMHSPYTGNEEVHIGGGSG